MAVTLTDLKEYVGAGGSTHDDVLSSALTDAKLLVDSYVGSSRVPQSIIDRCYLMVSKDLFDRRNNPHGILNSQYEQVTEPLRVSRDPMMQVYPILKKWVLPL